MPTPPARGKRQIVCLRIGRCRGIFRFDSVYSRTESLGAVRMPRDLRCSAARKQQDLFARAGGGAQRTGQFRACGLLRAQIRRDAP